MTGVVVTGAAGFIGSHLAERLIGAGHDVVGVDCLTDHYDVARKHANLASWAGEPGGRFVEADLAECDLEPLLDGTSVVFHLAAEAGVRGSWDGFARYIRDNVVVTQRLLDAARRCGVRRLVHASSSSVYGDGANVPCDEDQPHRPHSPYGVTKSAAEQLCVAYAENFGVTTVVLRLFTVFGPRQRPDMAVQRLVEAATGGRPFPLYGDGRQVRDFTYVADAAAAFELAGSADLEPGTVLNVSGGSTATLRDVIGTLEGIAGTPVAVERLPAQPGDVRRTGGSTDRITALLGWAPDVDLAAGIRRQYEWWSTALVEGS